MTAAPADALDAALQVARALEQKGISYAVGGALAYSLWGVPRATNDVDINLFVTPDRLASAVEALSDLGIVIDAEAAREGANRDGMFVAKYGPYRIDLFTPSIDFAWEAERTRVRHTIEATSAWFLSAEAIAVFKLLFFRGKDLVDLERLVAVQGPALDAAYVRRHIVALMGESDDRVSRWDALASHHSPK